MITNTIRWCHKFTNKRQLLIVLFCVCPLTEGKSYNNNDNTNEEKFINENQVKKK